MAARKRRCVVVDWLKAFLRWQRRLSSRLDSVLPKVLRIDGRTDFDDQVCPRWIKPFMRVYDVGGGKQPYISPGLKEQLGLSVIGLDVSASELESAPPGSYDRVIVCDITHYAGCGDGDLVIAQSVLEHVHDVERALDAIARILAPNGVALLFVPSKTALFARLNRILPERVKRGGLELIRESVKDTEGFPAYYDKCSPREFAEMAREMGLRVADERHYYLSSYFFSFVPFYILWRLWTLLYYVFDSRQGVESFAMVLQKPGC
jgi:SAM-dependent methyltransferase